MNVERLDAILEAMAAELRNGCATPSHALLLRFDIEATETAEIMDAAADGIDSERSF